ncbi:MAG TPA: Hsp20/alpha crystallin family protein [Armatimonadota bacterium]|jgi:HSP20 family protein
MDRNRGFDISGLRQQIEDLLEDFSGGGRRPQGGRGAGGDQPQHLTLNIVDSEGAFIVTAPLPGLAPEEIDISVRGQSLAIRAHQKPAGGERPNYLRREWGAGPYQRTVELGAPVDAERAEASFSHGVVTITLPKADPNKTRVIPLQGEETQAEGQSVEPETDITVEEAPVEVASPVPETVEKAEETAPAAAPRADTPAETAPEGEAATETAEGEEPPTRFYMRPPRRRGGQSRAAREAAKQAAAAEKAGAEPASAEAPAPEPPAAE